MITRSKSSLPESRRSLSSPRMRIRSPRTVQQTQPLFISTICSPVSFRRISLSTPASPNSFSITAMRCPCCSLRMRLTRVVFPLPRTPVSMVTGTMFSCTATSISPGARATLFERAVSEKFASERTFADDAGRQKRAHYSTLRMTKQPFALYGLSELIPLQQQALKVLAFGEFDPDGMVGRRAVALAQQQGRTGVRGGASDDFLEQLGRNAPGAGKGREQPSRPQQLQRVHVDVLVPARGARRVFRGTGELRRIEQDEVEWPALAMQLAQRLEDIRFAPFCAGGHAIQCEVAARPRESRRRRVDR